MEENLLSCFLLVVVEHCQVVMVVWFTGILAVVFIAFSLEDPLEWFPNGAYLPVLLYDVANR